MIREEIGGRVTQEESASEKRRQTLVERKGVVVQEGRLGMMWGERDTKERASLSTENHDIHTEACDLQFDLAFTTNAHSSARALLLLLCR
jgi:hypothetical protein